MACQEMDLYYAYLDALEAEKRKAQPWQCEVTIIPQPNQADAPATAAQAETLAPEPPAPIAAGRRQPRAKPSSFACDDPE
jgi:hypothetical protein